MSITDDDILSRLGLRVVFAPPDSGSNLSPAEAQALGDFFAAGGYWTLQANPYLRVRWYQFDSQYAKTNGFSAPLRDALKSAGIKFGDYPLDASMRIWHR